jgi:hypothetical protein
MSAPLWVHDERHPMLLGGLPKGALPVFHLAGGLSQEPLPFSSLGQQHLPVSPKLRLAGAHPAAPRLHAVLDSVQQPFDRLFSPVHVMLLRQVRAPTGRRLLTTIQTASHAPRRFHLHSSGRSHRRYVLAALCSYSTASVRPGVPHCGEVAAKPGSRRVSLPRQGRVVRGAPARCPRRCTTRSRASYRAG